MPLYIADYLAGTSHLNTVQHGAYLLLIMHYWAKGGLPDDEDSIRQVTRLDARSWNKNRDIIKAFFHDGWKHERLDKELAQAFAISKANSANARKSHENRRRTADNPQQNGTTQSPSPLQTLPSGESDARPKNAKGILVPPDWQPNEANIEAAHNAGLADAKIDAEVTRFRSYNRARGTTFTDLDAAWEGWCQLAKKPEAAAEPPAAPVEIDWDKQVAFFIRVGRWSRGLGPEPGMGGCKCPKEILIKHGIDPATGIARKVVA
jgi:uncharacterized protein YdaU (DUF1376 family)